MHVLHVTFGWLCSWLQVFVIFDPLNPATFGHMDGKTIEWHRRTALGSRKDMIRELLGLPQNPESATRAFAEGMTESDHRGNDRHFRFTPRDRRTDMNSGWPLADHFVQ
ncbi:hypothetical protein H4582DRAFT_2051662 [Lactarius indigo]|nr:hypothetical protein H4582DRAFT_2051662 [Lactarius indigo]